MQANPGKDLEEPRAIGGVFPLAQNRPGTGQLSVNESWSTAAKAVSLFHNARGAIQHVLSDLAPRRTWLPAYLCPDLLQATTGTVSNVCYFPIQQNMQPDIAFLSDRIESGDALLAINYFGCGLSADWLDFVASRPDVFWIEDCAQTIDTGGVHFGDVRIYSPRKILGAPDGGVLVDIHGRVSPPSLRPLADTSFMTAHRLRASDPDGRNRAGWYTAFRLAESRMCVSNLGMSQTTVDILQHSEISFISRKRRENYNILYAALSNIGFFPKPADIWTPLCFPILSDHSDRLGKYLATHLIFAPRYWLNQPAPFGDFPFEHSLSDRLIGLPCDQRYGPGDMARIINLMKAFQE